MRVLIFIIGLITIVSCQNRKEKFEFIILNEGEVNIDVLHSLKALEKTLLCTYLFLYGNECSPESETNKCSILKELGVEDECSVEYLENMRGWFKNDFLISHKLKNCPSLPPAIRNEITKIIIYRSADTLAIRIDVAGVNTAQEKNWEIEQKDSFLVNDYSFIKLIKDESKYN